MWYVVLSEHALDALLPLLDFVDECNHARSLLLFDLEIDQHSADTRALIEPDASCKPLVALP